MSRLTRPDENEIPLAITHPFGYHIFVQTDELQQSVVGERKQAFVRSRTFLIGILFVLGTCVVLAYSELVVSRSGSVNAVLLGATHMPPGAIAGLMALLFGNMVLRRISSRLSLMPGEIAVIYFMMVCAALVSSFGFTANFLPSLMGVNYYATPEGGWREMFYKHIPDWLVPWDPKGPESQPVSKLFYEGLRWGESIPWDRWIIPLIAWSILAFLMFFLMACVATLFRKQWVESERLSFPLVQLPTEMAAGQNGIMSNKLMWLGFALPFAFHGMNGLHNVIPTVPYLNVIWVLNEYMTSRPWTGIAYTPIVISFSIIGFSYLLPSDVSFSFWFFLLFFRFQDLIGTTLGYEPSAMQLYPAWCHVGYQSVGAFTVIAVAMVILAKPHLKIVMERVRGRAGKEVDASEFMGYRTAFWGGLISFALIVFWCSLAGVNPLVAAFMMFCFIFILVLVLTRCVSEVGLLMLQPVFRPIDLWAVGASRASLGAQNLTVLSFINGIFIRDPRTLMPAFMDSMKTADITTTRRRSFALGMGIAIVIAVAAGIYLQMNIIHKYGGIRLNSWFLQTNPVLYFGEAQGYLRGGGEFDIRGPIWFGVGAAFTTFLYIMRTRFWWWPFHPLGYAMGAAWPCIVYWSAFFAGWLVKSMILRYGGINMYKNSRPFFLGLILGEFTAGLTWTALSAIFGITSPSIPLT